MKHAPAYVLEAYTLKQADIKQRLSEFTVVPPTEYFYELCYCICTPQSKAVHAFQCVEKLRNGNFREQAFDPTPILRNPNHYIRFHNMKAISLQQLRISFNKIQETLASTVTPEEKRTWLARNIRGIGMKEASHFLRNIGYRNVAIIDRHILHHLHKCGVIEETTFPGSVKKYLHIEQLWKQFADDICIPLDELDLLFWSLQTGEILK